MVRANLRVGLGSVQERGLHVVEQDVGRERFRENLLGTRGEAAARSGVGPEVPGYSEVRSRLAARNRLSQRSEQK